MHYTNIYAVHHGRQTSMYITIFMAETKCEEQLSSANTLHYPSLQIAKQEVKVIWQKAPHGGPIPRLGVTPGGQKLYHWIPGAGFPISVP